MVLNYVIARVFNIEIDYKNPHNLYNINKRNIIVSLQGLLYTLSNFYVPQPIVATINSTGPLFVFILDYYINGTKINKSQFYGILIGLLGVIFIVNGGLILSFIGD